MELDESVLTCVHVMTNKRKYEYVPENKELGACESFTCSECLDLISIDQEKGIKHLQLVHKDCFIEQRLSESVKTN